MVRCDISTQQILLVLRYMFNIHIYGSRDEGLSTERLEA